LIVFTSARVLLLFLSELEKELLLTALTIIAIQKVIE